MSTRTIYGTETQTKLKKRSENLGNSNIHTLDKVNNKIDYEELQSIAVTAVDVLAQVRDRALSAEAKNEVLEKLLNEAQEAIQSRDLALNKYEPKEIDMSFMDKFRELTGDEERLEEIRRRKKEDMMRKQEEILRAKYKFTLRS